MANPGDLPLKGEKGAVRLALLDGVPAFAEPLHVGRPNLGNRQRLLERMNGMLDRNWLTNNGPFVQEFEARLAEFIGVKHCVAMCNATIALEIAIRAAGLKDEVILPAYTFIATAHALQWQEITPVFCDLDPRTHNLDPAKVEGLITPRTTGIIGVHVWGRPCPIDELTAIARAHDLTIMFDAAHAFGSSYRGRMIGGFGLAEVFSFHATKFLNSFEGGAVVTDNDELAARMRLMKNFGFAGYDDVVYVGTNGKMTEVCAAMGLTNLESFEEFQAANRRNYDCYRQGLGDLDGLALIKYDPKERYNYQYVVVEVDEAGTGLSRDELVAVLHAENVLARRYFWPGCHQMQPYRSHFPHAKLLLPETERLAPRIIVLPTGVAVGPAEIKAVCGIIRTAIANRDAVREALAQAGNNSLAQPFQPGKVTSVISRPVTGSPAGA
jgi:dTDP-4-amino-4,6-dideoxygalactose transaminase